MVFGCTVFLESLFDGGRRQPLVDANAAMGALIPAAVFGLSMALFGGRLCALAHQSLLVLLGVCCLGAIGLAMDIVCRILVDGTEPVQSMGKPSIALSSSKMWLSPWLVRRADFWTDVEGCDFALLLRVVQGVEVNEGTVLLASRPCFPHSNRGNHQVDLLLDMLCQDTHAIVQSSGFALFPWRQARDGCKAFQLSQADGVDADGKDPAL